MPGPSRIPLELLKARGSTLVKDRAAAEPTDAVELPPLPAEVAADKEAKAHWEYITPRLVVRRTVAAADLGLLAGMCLEWAEYVRAVRNIAKLVKSGKSYKGHLIDHPRVVRRGAFERYSKAAIQFGLTPSAKSRVQAEPPAKIEKPKDTTPRLRIAQ